jgi:7-carboxy-7-deazaguanine synthase
MALLVEEIFQTIQGEGWFAGTPVAFVRLYGCPVGCEFCDQGWATSNGDRSNPMESIEISEIISRVSKFNLKHIVVSGGEPLVQKESIKLISELRSAGFCPHIETAGIANLDAEAFEGSCWITLSPKDKVAQHLRHHSLPMYWHRANEIKIVIEDGTELDYYAERLLSASGVPIYLQPEWDKREQSTQIAIALLEKCRDPNHLLFSISRWMRLGIQAHKFWDLP